VQAIAPNLTVLVGELVGARLIAHAGTLMNLAKAPASTVQILGAEKALFRALKTKHATPKYGLIFHASLIGQAAPKNKGKISRVLAAKCALAVRVDALGETADAQIGIESRAKVCIISPAIMAVSLALSHQETTDGETDDENFAFTVSETRC
jgi:nucleolar protein 58